MDTLRSELKVPSALAANKLSLIKYFYDVNLRYDYDTQTNTIHLQSHHVYATAHSVEGRKGMCSLTHMHLDCFAKWFRFYFVHVAMFAIISVVICHYDNSVSQIPLRA